MRERLVRLVGEVRANDLTIGTFHATCARFLRSDGERVGLGRGFVIYDEDDQAALIKQIRNCSGMPQRTQRTQRKKHKNSVTSVFSFDYAQDKSVAEIERG